MQTAIEIEYDAAQNGCGVIDSSARGRLKLTGSTRLDFVHRLSTNDVLQLRAGQGAATIFLTPIGRMIDRVIVYVRENDLLLLASRDAQGRVLAWLKKFIFFNDDVQIQDVTASEGLLSLYGERSLDLIQSLMTPDSGFDPLGGPAAPSGGSRQASTLSALTLDSLPLHHWAGIKIKDIEVLIARADPIGAGRDGFHLMTAANRLPELRSILIAAGAIALDEETYQILRVEAGQPESGRELIDDTIPLEANLWADVSFTKGCYTGQEIIARMESRQRLAKQLMGLRLMQAVSLPAKIILEGGEVGRLTSVVHSPAHGWLGLGYCQPALALEDQTVQVQTDTQSIAGRISRLPFKF